VAAAFFICCDPHRVYDHYVHTPLQGWEKNDTLQFNVPRLNRSGHFTMSLGMRISEGYPFTSISMIVEQRIYPGKRFHRDTIKCEFDRQDPSQNNGVSFYQFSYPIRKIVLAKGDSLHIRVRHNMKREIMPGISDVGIKLED